LVGAMRVFEHTRHHPSVYAALVVAIALLAASRNAESEVAAQKRAPAADSIPVLVEDRFISPNTGRELGRIPESETDGFSSAILGEPSGYASPVAGEPHRYRFKGLLVDATTRLVDQRRSFRMYDHHNLSPLGSGARWIVEIASSDPPTWVERKGRLFAAERDGLVARDANSGAVLWKAAGRTGGLALVRDTVVAVDCSEERVVGYGQDDGRIRWEAKKSWACLSSPFIVTGEVIVAGSYGMDMDGS
jgi:outer membrane protein assembly factor BamB